MSDERWHKVNGAFTQTVWQYLWHHSQETAATNSEQEHNLRCLRPYESASHLWTSSSVTNPRLFGIVGAGLFTGRTPSMSPNQRRQSTETYWCCSYTTPLIHQYCTKWLLSGFKYRLVPVHPLDTLYVTPNIEPPMSHPLQRWIPPTSNLSEVHPSLFPTLLHQKLKFYVN